MKVKVIAKDCVEHIPGCTCCDYDLKKEIFYVEKDFDDWVIVYGDKFPDRFCYLHLHDIEVVEE